MSVKTNLRVGLQQRVLPTYRVAFLEALGDACPNGLYVFAGRPRPEEMIVSAERLNHAHLTQTVNYHLFSPSSSFYLCWQSGILDWVKDKQPDILMVEANPRYLSTRRAIRWMRERRRPVIGWGLGAPPLSGALAPLRRWERQSFIHSLDGIIAYSRRGAQEYQNMGIAPQNVFVACNAIVPKPEKPPQARPESFRGKPNILFIGRLQERKKIDNLLYACAGLPEPIQPHLVIVGDGPARATWEALAKSVYPDTEFVGAKHGSDLEKYFDDADLFVLPGSGGLAVQQAMAHGLPVIVAQGDGTQDDLVRPATPQQPGNGWIIPPDDVPALTDALRCALSDVAGLRQRGSESFQIVLQEANLENMVKVFVEAIEKISHQLVST